MRPSTDIPPVALLAGGLLGLFVGAGFTPAAGAVTAVVVAVVATLLLVRPVLAPVPVRARPQPTRRRPAA